MFPISANADQSQDWANQPEDHAWLLFKATRRWWDGRFGFKYSIFLKISQQVLTNRVFVQAGLDR
jgi:hypothetical protein